MALTGGVTGTVTLRLAGRDRDAGAGERADVGEWEMSTDWHGDVIQEHWQELVWQAHWFLSAMPDEDLFWNVAISGPFGLAVQVVERKRK